MGKPSDDIERVLSLKKFSIGDMLQSIRCGTTGFLSSFFPDEEEIDINYDLAIHRFNDNTIQSLSEYQQDKINEVIDALVMMEIAIIFERRKLYKFLGNHKEKASKLQSYIDACNLLLEDLADDQLANSIQQLHNKYVERSKKIKISPFQELLLYDLYNISEDYKRIIDGKIIVLEHGKNAELKLRNALITFIYRTLSRPKRKLIVIKLVSDICNCYFGFNGDMKLTPKIVENIIGSR